MSTTTPPAPSCAHAAVCPDCSATSARAAADALTRHRAAVAATRPPCPLTPRHLDVLRAIAFGATYEAIGHRLHISKSTVHSHITTMLRLTATTSSASLVGAAVWNGWIE